jgi:hypothetical protein
VDVVAAVGADEQSAAVVQPGDGALDDPAVAAEPGTVLCLAASDDRLDAALPDEAAVLVGDQRPRSPSRPTDPAANRRYSVEQLEQLGDIVAVAAGERPGKRDAAAVSSRWCLLPARPRSTGLGTCFRAPFFACRWLESAIARSHSS